MEIQATRFHMDKEKVEESVKDKQKLKEAFEKFPHARLLYDDFKSSVIGLIVSFLGLLCKLLDPYFYEIIKALTAFCGSFPLLL